MKTYHYSEDRWYMDVQPLWMRVLRWIVWLGGWEQIIHDEDGYRYRWRAGEIVRRKVKVYRGRELAREIFRSVTPLGFLGNKIVVQWFGFHISTRRGYLCAQWPSGAGKGWRVYWSRNATPNDATLWLVGAPENVREAAEDTAERAAERRS